MSFGFLHHIEEKGLATGDFAFSFGQTVMVALLPVLLSEHTGSSSVIGSIIALEGVCAILLPYVIGHFSDALGPRPTRWAGPRSIFIWVSTPMMMIALVATPFLPGIGWIALSAFLFFLFLHAYRTPYLTLMSEKIPRKRWGRIQGLRGAMHAAAIGLALGAGGPMLSIWQPLPFIVAAVVVLVGTVPTLVSVRRLSNNGEYENGSSDHKDSGFLGKELRRPEIRRFLAANVLWSSSVDGIRPYIFLFASNVLGLQLAMTSAILLPLLAATGLGSIIAGRLSDRKGIPRTLTWLVTLMGVSMIFGVFIRNIPEALVLMFMAGIGASAILSLPYPAFMEISGGSEAGKSTGAFAVSNGVSHLIAPVVVGGLIDLAKPIFPDYAGYPAMWPVVGVFALAGAAMMRSISSGKQGSGK